MAEPEIIRDPLGVLWIIPPPEWQGYRTYDSTGKPITRTFTAGHKTKLGQIASWEGAVAPLSVSEGAKVPIAYPQPPPPPPPTTDRLLFMPKLGPATDSYLNGADAARKAYVNQKLDMPMAYVDNWAAWLPSQQYFDIEVGAYNNKHSGHRNAPALTDQQKSWILRDADGELLFIKYGNAENGQLPQFAADWGNPDFRAYAKTVVDSILAKHPGVHFDDANTWPNCSDGHTLEPKKNPDDPDKLATVPPINPRTGREMTRNEWAEALVSLLEEIRAAHPQAFLSANQWWSDSYPKNDGSDPYVQRTAKAMTMMAKEQGLTDTGLTGGTGQWSIHRLFQWVDAMHAAGSNVWLMSYATAAADVEANLCGHWLTRKAGDSVCGGEWWKSWFAPYDWDLGDGPERTRSTDGLFRRDLTNGIALLNEPSASAKTVQLGKPHINAAGQTVTSVTLGPRVGALLRVA